MSSIEGFSSVLVNDHAPLWKIVTKLENFGRGEEIGSGNVVIALNHSMDLILEAGPISCG